MCPGCRARFDGLPCALTIYSELYALCCVLGAVRCVLLYALQLLAQNDCLLTLCVMGAGAVLMGFPNLTLCAHVVFGPAAPGAERLPAQE